MVYLKPFSELGKNDAPIAGGKGASLGEMTQAGIPVPPGFVVLADAFEYFIAKTDLVQEIEAILATVNHNEIHTVEKASESIQALILSREMPADIQAEINTSFADLNTEYVAVRSSATAEDGTDHAWAGQLESYLNTTEKDLLLKVKHCWASLFTPRAIFYRFEKGLHAHKISVAVVVQKMVTSEVSGIAFSVHPVTEDRNQIIIEAGFGLGEAIVSGQITPDSYVVEKTPRNILDVNVSTQTRGLYRVEGGGNEWQTIPEPKASSQVMNEAQISEFADLILKIENHYGFPCDIEWAYEAGKFYIVQSRPITTLQPLNSEPSVMTIDQFVSPGLKDFNPDDYHFLGMWKNPVFAEVFWIDCLRQEIIEEFRLSMTTIGTVHLSGGNFFISKIVQKELGDQIEKRIEKVDRAFFENMITVTDVVCKEGVSIGESLRMKEPDVENFRQFKNTAERLNFIWLVGASYFVEAAEKKLQESVIKDSFPAEHALEIIPELKTALYYRHKELVQLEKQVQGKTLTEIQSDPVLNKQFVEQVKKYPWVEIMNFMGESLTYERLYDQIIHMKDVAEKHLYTPEKPLSSELVFRAECLHACGYLKQAGAEYFSEFSEKVLPFLQRVAERLAVSYRELLYLIPGEIEDGLQGVLSNAELKRRSNLREETSNCVLISKEKGGLTIVEEPHDIETLRKKMIPRADADTQEVKGQVGNPGKYTGQVKIIMNTDDFGKMEANDVLVSTMTTPDFIILMQKSGAIVTDIGGMLCHAAIVSREMNKPCIIGTKFATQILRDGDLVEVDATNGVVKILERADTSKKKLN